MKLLIPEKEALFREPRILAVLQKDVQVLLPSSFVDQIEASSNKGSFNEQILKLIGASVERGVTRIIPVPDDITLDQADNAEELRFAQFKVASNANLGEVRNIMWAELWMHINQRFLSFVQTIGEAQLYDQIFLVARDERAKYAKGTPYFTVISMKDLWRDFLSTPASDARQLDSGFTDLANNATYVADRRVLTSLSLVIVGVLIGILGRIIWLNLNAIIETLPEWIIILLIPTFALFLFWLRSRLRIVYGTAEFVFGFLLALYTLIPNFNSRPLDPAEGLQILGGVYVMVRGLDNIGKALVSSRWEATWTKIFGLQ